VSTAGSGHEWSVVAVINMRHQIHHFNQSWDGQLSAVHLMPMGLCLSASTSCVSVTERDEVHRNGVLHAWYSAGSSFVLP
jgi:hypothetical protein